MNELVVPLGQPVIVQLTAKDVIHSFGVPAGHYRMRAVVRVVSAQEYVEWLGAQSL